jgi:hypothetical protein
MLNDESVATVYENVLTEVPEFTKDLLGITSKNLYTEIAVHVAQIKLWRLYKLDA